MNGFALVAVAVALAMDAFAVSIASGAALRDVSPRQTFRLAWHFGLFQAGMPVLGWAAGQTFVNLIRAYAHWIAFGLLAFIAVRMIKEALEPGEEDKPRCDPTRGLTLVMLSVATSIDALAVGLSLSAMGVSVWFPALIIGLTALAFTGVGLHIGRKVAGAARMGVWAEVAGGTVLILISLNILRKAGVFGQNLAAL